MPKLGEKETREILKKAGIPLVGEYTTRTEKEALSCAKRLGYPVAMKVSSKDIIHKTDFGLVKTDLRYPEEVRKAYREIIKNVKKHCPRARMDGVIVQHSVRGYETVVGGGRDPQFGPFIMFGLGGIWVEAMKDVSFRVCPVSREHALDMVKEIKGYRILKGFRGKPAGDIKALVSVILRASRLMMKTPRIKEMDINPLFVRPRGVMAVDFRIMV